MSTLIDAERIITIWDQEWIKAHDRIRLGGTWKINIFTFYLILLYKAWRRHKTLVDLNKEK